HEKLARDINAAFDEGLAWFKDPKNRDEAIAISVQSIKIPQGDAERSYDFLRKIDFFAPDDTVSRTTIRHVIDGMEAIGDYDNETANTEKRGTPGRTKRVNERRPKGAARPQEAPHRTWTKPARGLPASALSRERDVLLRVVLTPEDASVVLQMSPADAREIAA